MEGMTAAARNGRRRFALCRWIAFSLARFLNAPFTALEFSIVFGEADPAPFVSPDFDEDSAGEIFQAR